MSFTDEELTDLQDRLSTTFRDLTLKHVWIVDGWNVSLTVNRGHLIVRDGVGEHVRERKLTRSQRVVRRIVILGGSGVVSIPAVQWCTEVGITLLFVDSHGDTYATSFGNGTDEPRLRRAQALAHANGVALGIAQRLIAEKIRKHAILLTTRFGGVPGGHEGASTLLADLEAVEGCATVDKLREIEARAAATYFAVWSSSVSATFTTRDAERVPEHWRSPSSRNSPFARGRTSSRKAADPVNAMLNYAYGLAETECRIAAVAVGLDPALGVMHSDVKNRDSLALDLLEVLRPSVEEHILDVLSVRRFRAVDFYETNEGVCRLTPAVSHQLTSAMRTWAKMIAPYAEDVSHAFAESSALEVKLRTPLTRTRHRAAQSVRRSATVEAVRAPVASRPYKPAPTCMDCGKELIERRAKRCPDCDAVARNAGAHERAAKGRAARQAIIEATGVDPAQTDVAKARRAAGLARERELCRMFESEHVGVFFDREAYILEVLPKLRDVPLSKMVQALGLSDSAASKIRRGVSVPHPRHWDALRNLCTSATTQ